MWFQTATQAFTLLLIEETIVPTGAITMGRPPNMSMPEKTGSITEMDLTTSSKDLLWQGGGHNSNKNDNKD